MKVAFLAAEYPPYGVGGAAHSSALIANELRAYDVEIDVYGLKDGEEGAINPDVHQIIQIPDWGTLPHKFRCNAAVLAERVPFDEYDLVHAYGPAHLPAVAATSSVPVVGTWVNMAWICLDVQRFLREGCPEYTIRTGFRYGRSAYDSLLYRVGAPLLEAVGRRVARRADALTVQTARIGEILVNNGFDAEKTTVVPNVLDPRFDLEHGGREYLLYVGRLSDEKGPLDLLKAYGSLPVGLREQYPLKMCGKGPLEATLYDYIAKEGLKNVSIEHVEYENLPAVYRDAAAMVHPAKWPEPFSRTWLEAMATGTPIISSRNPSASIVLDGVASFHDPFRIRSLQRTIERCLGDAETLRRMSARGRSAVRQYHPDQVIPKYVSVYDSVA